MVCARLHRHVEGGTAGAFACCAEGDDLGVRPAGVLVPALPHDLAVAYDHGADDRVRMRRPAAALGKLQRALHVLVHRRNPRFGAAR